MYELTGDTVHVDAYRSIVPSDVREQACEDAAKLLALSSQAETDLTTAHQLETTLTTILEPKQSFPESFGVYWLLQHRIKIGSRG